MTAGTLTDTLVLESGNTTVSGTLASTGKITADAGIDIDNFNIDGTTIALSSGDMVIDGAEDIILDAAGNQIRFKDNGTEVGFITMSGSDLGIKSTVNDKDIVFKGVDNSSEITALTLDMSDAGTAIFNHDIKLGDSSKAIFGAGDDFQIFHDGGGFNQIIAANDHPIQIKSSSENMIKAIPNGAVEIYHDNAKKINTTSTGIAVTGTAVATTDTDTSNTGSVTLDFGANQNFVLTLTGNVTLANPTTETVGQSGFIACIQDGTGSRTLSLGTDYETAGGAGITLTTTASATDLIPYVVIAADRILLGTPQLAFS